MSILNNEVVYSERELYPKRISSMLREVGATVEEQFIIEEYLLSTFGGESVDL